MTGGDAEKLADFSRKADRNFAVAGERLRTLDERIKDLEADRKALIRNAWKAAGAGVATAFTAVIWAIKLGDKVDAMSVQAEKDRAVIQRLADRLHDHELKAGEKPPIK